ncbi:MAG: radical SAM protein, partial [Bilophila wadsworthia]
MAILGAAPWKEKWLELGVQTLNDATLRRINRGHDAAASAKAIELAEKTDVQVCAHLMLGLPGETPDDVHATVRRLNDLPVHGVKLHNVYVCRN